MEKKKSIFKRWWFWLIVILVIGAVATAGSGDDGSDEPKKVAENQQEKKSEEKKEENKIFKVGDTVDLNGIQITLKSAKFVNPAEYAEPEKGKIIMIEFTAKNNKDEDILVDNTEFTISDADGNMYEQYFGFDDTVFTSEIKKGKQFTGKVAFDVPESSKYEIYYEPSFSWDSGEIVFEVTKDQLQ